MIIRAIVRRASDLSMYPTPVLFRVLVYIHGIYEFVVVLLLTSPSRPSEAIIAWLPAGFYTWFAGVVGVFVL